MENNILIYVPDLTSYECFVVRDTNTLRAYKEMPYTNKTIEYRDYYINSHYLYQDGSQQFSQYSTIPVCLDSSVLTTSYGYRNDIADICIVAFIIIFSIYFLVSSCIKCLFKGRKIF